MARYRDPEHKAPKTITACKDDIIQSMRQGGALIARLHATGEWEAGYEFQRARNPSRVPETGLGSLATKRDWQAARILVEEGVAIVVQGSLDLEGAHGNTVILQAGPNFPK